MFTLEAHIQTRGRYHIRVITKIKNFMKLTKRILKPTK